MLKIFANGAAKQESCTWKRRDKVRFYISIVPSNTLMEKPFFGNNHILKIAGDVR